MRLLKWPLITRMAGVRVHGPASGGEIPKNLASKHSTPSMKAPWRGYLGLDTAGVKEGWV